MVDYKVKIMILTQDENVYLPTSIATICQRFADDIVCVVTCPPMSTHGGAITGFFKHLMLFGFKGSFLLGVRVLRAKFGAMMPVTKKNQFFSMKQVADYFDVPHYQVSNVDLPHFHDLIDEYAPDLLISMSCPQIIRKAIRNKLSMGCINVHGAPLPKYRGLMPAFWVLKNGENKTAVTVHDLAEKLDDGDILVQKDVDITTQDTWNSLVIKTKMAGAEALIDAILQIKDSNVVRRPNLQEESTYFGFPTHRDRASFLRSGRSFF